ncbi:MAG TPA: TolC family protein [Usitatibacter sp.]|nr:TolC family protein [Usitatibacter sp.]
MRRAAIAATACLAAGCASLSVDRNLAAWQAFGETQLGAKVRALDTEAARREAEADVDRLLAQPLSVDDAVRISLAYSPSVQALLAGHAAQSAAATRSARLPNPVFAFERLVRREHGGAEVEITRSLAFSLVDLLFLPSRIESASLRQEALRLQGAGDVLQAAAETRQAWVRAVAARQALAYHEQVRDAAEASAELARRMQAVGNWSRLQRAREQAFYADAAAQLARAQQAAVAAREALVRRLGLDERRAARLVLPDRLPDLPARLRDEGEIARAALASRLDVRLARAELDATAKSLGIARVASVVDGAHVKAIRETETGAAPRRGYEVELPLPLFDLGDAQRAEARARYMASFHRAAEAEAAATSRVREAYGAYRTAHDLARHYRDEVVPLRKLIADEMLLRYNGMLAGVFELLAEAREQVRSVAQAIDAQRDFWLADAALHAELLGRPLSTTAPGAGPAAPAAASSGAH